DLEGAEVYTIYIKDLTNQVIYSEEIPNTFSSVYFRTGVEWANDNETIFYLTLDAAQRPDKVWRHKIGTDPQHDVLICHDPDETYSLFIQKSRDNAYIYTHHHSTIATEMRFLSADHPEDELRILSPRAEGVEYMAAHYAGQFFIVTNYLAKNF